MYANSFICDYINLIWIVLIDWCNNIFILIKNYGEFNYYSCLFTIWMFGDFALTFVIFVDISGLVAGFFAPEGFLSFCLHQVDSGPFSYNLWPYFFHFLVYRAFCVIFSNSQGKLFE